MILGIDFSVNSTGICYSEDDTLKYTSHFKSHQLSPKLKQCIKLLESTGNFNIFYYEKLNKNSDYSLGESEKLKDAIDITENIINNNVIDKEVDLIGIEGFSYNSTGASQIELIGYQYTLRKRIYDLGINFKVFSPNQIKMCAGKGNLSKALMIEHYLNNKTECELLKTCKIREIVLNNLENFKSGKKWTKPFEDLVDAYWTFKLSQKHFQTP